MLTLALIADWVLTMRAVIVLVVMLAIIRSWYKKKMIKLSNTIGGVPEV